ncbi:MAG: LEA type 2 family protein [Methanomassiliicoccales archaeon]|nr:LEA type 2 family protein [Methanomassiliicoccales archaeon]
MKRGTIALLVVVIIIAIVVGFLSYQQVQQRQALEDIQVSADGVKLVSLNTSSATLNIILRFTNPNANAATLDRTDYTLYINDINVGSGQNLEKTTIPAGGSVVIPQLFTVSYSGGLQTIWSLIQQGGADWRLVGTAYFDMFLGTVSVPYDLNGTITL